MRWPVWFTASPSNAAVQRGAPTAAEANGVQTSPYIGPAVPGIAGPVQTNMPGWGPWYVATSNRAVQTGAPPAQPAWALRSPHQWATPPDPVGHYHVLRHYDWGAEGFGYIPGQITSNPIGAGVVTTPNRAGMATRPPGGVAQVRNKTFIFYNQQMQNWGIQPGTAPLYPPEILAQLIGPLASAAALPNPGPGY